MIQRPLSIVSLCVFAAIICNTAKGNSEVKYVGCMKRTSGSKAFTDKVRTDSDRVHIKLCIDQCWKKRQKFAGMQGGTRCYCTSDLADVVTVPETECYRRCSKNCQQICGGEDTLSVYQTDNLPSPDPPRDFSCAYNSKTTTWCRYRTGTETDSSLLSSECSSPTNRGYVKEPAAAMTIKPMSLIKAIIGCYDKYKSLPVLCPKTFAPLSTVRMTAPLCVHYCASVHKAKFGTTVDKETCCCSNSVSGAVNTRLEYCNIRCRGDRQQTVGCIGLRRQRVLVSSVQLSRLPKFKAWPPSTFTNAVWLAPLFPPGENFELKGKALMSFDQDPSLKGLLVKKTINDPDLRNLEGPPAQVALMYDKAVVSLAGGDKRKIPPGGVAKSVAISQVSDRKEAAAPQKNEGNALIIGALIVGFAIIVIVTGIYFYTNSNSCEDTSKDSDSE